MNRDEEIREQLKKVEDVPSRRFSDLAYEKASLDAKLRGSIANYLAPEMVGRAIAVLNKKASEGDIRACEILINLSKNV